MSGETNKRYLISVVGPTAVGKTALGIRLAKKLNTEIISVDSRQFYKEMNIGTAKPPEEERDSIRHHFIDSHSIVEEYSAGQFGRDAGKLLARLFEQYRTVIAVGGSSLYLKSLWEGFDDIPPIEEHIRVALNQQWKQQGLQSLLVELKKKDPKYYDEVDRDNGQRVVRALEVIRGTGKSFSTFRTSEQRAFPYENIKIGLTMERSVLFDRINLRMDRMIATGLFEEAERLYSFKEHNALQTVGYSEIYGYMDGNYDKEEAIRLLERNSRRYAKRQLTWFKRYKDIRWFEPTQEECMLKYVAERLKESSV